MMNGIFLEYFVCVFLNDINVEKYLYIKSFTEILTWATYNQ